MAGQSMISGIPQHSQYVVASRLPSTGWFGLTILLSAFLLFQVQPLIAKQLLPRFGGSAAVWTTCLLFFQAVLVAGYSYAHWLAGQTLRRQTRIHSSLLAASLLFLPILPSVKWKVIGSDDPRLGILVILCVTVGLPYFLLSATSPLLQSWYGRGVGAPLPWRFFALSNAGSLGGLLAYPLLVEPWLTNQIQGWAWSVAYIVVALLVGALALTRQESGTVEADKPVQEKLRGAPAFRVQLLWIALAANASALLLAGTDHVAENIAAVPLLWVAPLSLYLLSFILCFDRDRWYRRSFFVPFGAAALLLLLALIFRDLVIEATIPNIATFDLGLFVFFMICHGELARLRPEKAFLTTFYLMISIGGAIGGLFIAIIAPVMFHGQHDIKIVLGSMLFLFPVLAAGEGWGKPKGSILQKPLQSSFAMSGAVLLFAWLAVRVFASQDKPNFFDASHDLLILAAFALWGIYLIYREGAKRCTRTISTAVLTVFALSSAWLMWRDTGRIAGSVRLLDRNFYGSLSVVDLSRDPYKGTIRKLGHGIIEHGSQWQPPLSERHPTSYYALKSGVGRAITTLMDQGPVKAGVIGLGAGTLSAYARPGDHYRFYEINPLILQLAQSEFTFLELCADACDVVLGDARLMLESEAPQQFDILIVDAFSGDAVPVHLLTLEALKIYWRHLKPNGILAVHVSNIHVALEPVIFLAAQQLGKDLRAMPYEGDPAVDAAPSNWVLMTSRADFFSRDRIRRLAQPIHPVTGLHVWTDDYSDLFRVLK